MAPMQSELSFDRDDHVYFFRGRPLSGITGLVGLRLGKVFPACLTEVIDEARFFGTSMHQDLEAFVKKGRKPTHDVSRFACEEFSRICPKGEYLWASEYLVSDFKDNATAIDIIGIKDGQAITFDLKTGNFNRDYCSWQLGIGNYFLEISTGIKAVESYVISSKDKFTYTIKPKSRERVEALLYG